MWFVCDLLFLFLFVYQRITIDSSDPKWIGCWWLPYTVTAGLCLLNAIPMWGYPRDLPGLAHDFCWGLDGLLIITIFNVIFQSRTATYEWPELNRGLSIIYPRAIKTLNILSTSQRTVCGSYHIHITLIAKVRGLAGLTCSLRRKCF